MKHASVSERLGWSAVRAAAIVAAAIALLTAVAALTFRLGRLQAINGLWTIAGTLILPLIVLLALAVGLLLGLVLWRALPGLWRLVTLIVVPVAAVALGWGLLNVFLLLMIDTDYAPGYSRRAFDSIELGFSEDEVIARLGEPLRVYETDPYTIWVYSDEPLEHIEAIPNDAKRLTRVRFDHNGLLLDLFDVGCGPMGAGQIGYGYLGVEFDEWETLVGTPKERFRDTYGEPLQVKESRATRVLWYSMQSPASMDYRIRNIELDRDGRVVATVKEHYGD